MSDVSNASGEMPVHSEYEESGEPIYSPLTSFSDPAEEDALTGIIIRGRGRRLSSEASFVNSDDDKAVETVIGKSEQSDKPPAPVHSPVAEVSVRIVSQESALSTPAKDERQKNINQRRKRKAVFRSRSSDDEIDHKKRHSPSPSNVVKEKWSFTTAKHIIATSLPSSNPGPSGVTMRERGPWASGDSRIVNPDDDKACATGAGSSESSDEPQTPAYSPITEASYNGEGESVFSTPKKAELGKKIQRLKRKVAFPSRRSHDDIEREKRQSPPYPLYAVKDNNRRISTQKWGSPSNFDTLSVSGAGNVPASARSGERVNNPLKVTQLDGLKLRGKMGWSRLPRSSASESGASSIAELPRTPSPSRASQLPDSPPLVRRTLPRTPPSSFDPSATPDIPGGLRESRVKAPAPRMKSIGNSRKTAKSKCTTPRTSSGRESSASSMSRIPARGVSSKRYSPGTIKLIKIQNIMCHSYFELDCEPNFNFILGENGSGKSAILAAIIAGLGGKAYDTGRGISFRTLIRTGQPVAKIEIVISGRESKFYGEEIRIIRTLYSEGRSSYQVSDVKMRMKNISRSELDLLLFNYSIQVSNPLAVLNQEMSRNFLTSNDPVLLYGFFNRALLITPCQKLLENADANIEEAMELIKSKKEQLQKLRVTQEEKSMALELFRRISNGMETLKKLEKELCWTKVKELKEVLLKADEEAGAAADALKLAEEEKALILNKEVQYQAAQAVFKEKWDEVSNSVETKSIEYESMRRANQKLKLTISKLEGAKMTVTASMDQLQKRMKAFEEELTRQQESGAKVIERRRRKADARCKEIKSQLTKLEEELAQYSAKLVELKEAHVAAVVVEGEHVAVVKNLKVKNEMLRRELRESAKLKKSKFTVFGQEMVVLLERIHLEEENFRHKPRGPLATCFTVKDEKWGSLVEYILGSSLFSFAVDNNADRLLLDKLINEVYYKTRKKPSICQISFGNEKMDISVGKAVCGHPTVLDVIEIEENDFSVFNWLVDSAHVERILLFDNYRDACELMKDVRTCPRTAIKGYSLDEYVFYPDPHFKALAQASVRCRRLLRLRREVVAMGAVEKCADELERGRRELSLKEDGLALVRKTVKDSNEKVLHCERKVQSLRQAICKLDWQLQKSSSSVDSNLSDPSSCLCEMEELRSRLKEQEPEVAFIEVQIEKLKEQISASSVAQLEKEIRDLQAEKERMEIESQSVKMTPAKIEREIRAVSTKLENATRRKEAAISELKKARKMFKSVMNGALKKFPQPINQVNRTAAEIQKELNTLREAIDTSKKEGGEGMEKQLVRDHKAVKESADTMDREIKMLTGLVMLLKAMIKVQKEIFKKKIAKHGIEARANYRANIKNRGYHGDLVIDHERKSLACWVSPDSTSTIRAQKNLAVKNGIMALVDKKGVMDLVRTMSGGERSVAGICLLLACWQLMDTPFYVLDEFDVFMDSMNRTMSEYILVSLARSKPNAQVFVLTPHTFDCVPPNSHKTIRLYKTLLSVEPAKGDVRRDRSEETSQQQRKGI